MIFIYIYITAENILNEENTKVDIKRENWFDHQNPYQDHMTWI